MLLYEITSPDSVELVGIAREIRGTQTFEQIAKLVRKHFPMTKVKINITSKLEEGEMNIGAHYRADRR